MPVAIWIFMRIARAVAATALLVVDSRHLRHLPWPYLRALPRRNGWIGLITVTLALTVAGAVGGALAPQPASRVLAETAIAAGCAGVLSSWVRYFAKR